MKTVRASTVLTPQFRSVAASSFRFFALVLAGLFVQSAELRALTIEYRSGATNLVLNSADARQQLLAVTATETDVTREAQWTAEPSGVVQIDPAGRVSSIVDNNAWTADELVTGLKNALAAKD